MSQIVEICEGAGLILTNPSVGKWEGKAAWNEFGNWHEMRKQSECWPTWQDVDAAVSRALGRAVEHSQDEVLVDKNGDMVLTFATVKRVASGDNGIIDQLRQARVRVTLAHDSYVKAHGDAVAAKKLLLQAKADLDALVTGLTEELPLFDQASSPLAAPQEPHPAIIQPPSQPLAPEPATATPAAPAKAEPITRDTLLIRLLPSPTENRNVASVTMALAGAKLHTVGDLLDRADSDGSRALWPGSDAQRPYAILKAIKGVGNEWAYHIGEQLISAGLLDAALSSVAVPPQPAETAYPDRTAEKEASILRREQPLCVADQRLMDQLRDYRARQATGHAAPCWGKWSEFTVTLYDGNTVEVLYIPEYIGNTAHFDFHGPVSDTGYKSHFWHGPRAVEIVAWATAHCNQLARDLAKAKEPKKRGRKAAKKAEAVDA